MKISHRKNKSTYDYETDKDFSFPTEEFIQTTLKDGGFNIFQQYYSQMQGRVATSITLNKTEAQMLIDELKQFIDE